jgi:signal transduction histidine kinase
LEVVNLEQRRIGQDLHDGLCQHLTGTALAGHVLKEKLTAIGQAEAKDARRIVDLIEEAIALARSVAKGIYPVEILPEGLMQALADFAATTSELYTISCKFVCDAPALVHSPAAAMHLYRITQEAVSNAVRHGHATEIIISLEVLDSGMRLCIADNGLGIATPVQDGKGIGLQVMADRANSIGASFAIGRSISGGAEVSCILPYGDMLRS